MAINRNRGSHDNSVKSETCKQRKVETNESYVKFNQRDYTLKLEV